MMVIAETLDGDVGIGRTVRLLGGQRTLHRRIRSRLDAHDLLRMGLPGYAAYSGDRDSRFQSIAIIQSGDRDNTRRGFSAGAS